MERSAVSLGPTALAARDRLLADIGAGRPAPGGRLGAERELAERLGVARSTIRAALADLERSGVVRRTRGRAGGIFVAERKVERDLTSLAGLPAYLRRQGFESDARVLSTATIEADAETAAALGARRRRARARGRPRTARRRRADLARARPLPGRAVPGPARPRARRVAVRAARDALRPGARRGGGADRGRRRRRRRGAPARAAAGRAAARRRPHRVGRRRPRRSSARTTCSAPTGRGSSCAPARRPPRRRSWALPCMSRDACHIGPAGG